jgi:hypothetical protein
VYSRLDALAHILGKLHGNVMEPAELAIFHG